VDAGAIVTVPLFILVLYVFVGAFLLRAAYLVRLVRAGRASNRTGDLPVRTARE